MSLCIFPFVTLQAEKCLEHELEIITLRNQGVAKHGRPTQGLLILSHLRAYLGLQINSSQLGSSMPVQNLVTPTSSEDHNREGREADAVTPDTWNMASFMQNYHIPGCLLSQG